jgi:hypothetical protein
MESEKLQLFENQTIRTAWDEEHEEWYFAIVDVVGVLTESIDGRKYWNKLKQRLKEEGNETVTNCHQLKLKAADGKRRFTDVATTEISKQQKPEGLEQNKKAAELNHMVTSMIEASANMGEDE